MIKQMVGLKYRVKPDNTFVREVYSSHDLPNLKANTSPKTMPYPMDIVAGTTLLVEAVLEAEKQTLFSVVGGQLQGWCFFLSHDKCKAWLERVQS